MSLPVYLSQGQITRLFPVLSETSKEGRTTSVVLSCLANVEPFGAHLLQTLGAKVGKRGRLTCYTEVVFHKDKNPKAD